MTPCFINGHTVSLPDIHNAVKSELKHWSKYFCCSNNMNKDILFATTLLSLGWPNINLIIVLLHYLSVSSYSKTSDEWLIMISENAHCIVLHTIHKIFWRWLKTNFWKPFHLLLACPCYILRPLTSFFRCCYIHHLLFSYPMQTLLDLILYLEQDIYIRIIVTVYLLGMDIVTVWHTQGNMGNQHPY